VTTIADFIVTVIIILSVPWAFSEDPSLFLPDVFYRGCLMTTGAFHVRKPHPKTPNTLPQYLPRIALPGSAGSLNYPKIQIHILIENGFKEQKEKYLFYRTGDLEQVVVMGNPASIQTVNSSQSADCFTDFNRNRRKEG